MAFQSSTERGQCMLTYLAIYNDRRCHMAVVGSTPIQQVELLRATE